MQTTDGDDAPGGLVTAARTAVGAIGVEDGAAAAIAELAGALVRADTRNPPGGELRAARLVHERLRAAGIAAELLPFGDGRANLVARIRGRGERPALLFSGHLDTVPVADAERWTVPPLGGLVHDGRVHGRGALDMKGAVAAMVVTMERLHRLGRTPAGDLVLALTAGEETDSVGATMLCDAGLLDDVGEAVIGEPTGLDVGIAHRGALWVSAAMEGTAAHGSQPHAGVNAVCALLDWLTPFSTIAELIGGSDPILGRGSVSLNSINGGQAPNVIPDAAQATLDFRTVPGHSHPQILAALRARLEGVRLTVLRDSPPISTPRESPLVEAAIAAVGEVVGEHRVRGLPYMTDGSIFVDRLGASAVVVGPGAEADAHTADESVAVADLARAARIYGAIAARLIFP